MNNKNKKQAKPTIWSFIHTHRIKIVLIMFLVVIPTTLLLTAYLGAYTTNKKVHFDTEVTENTEFINSFITKDDIEAFELIIEWTALKSPDLNADNILVGGYYDFNIKYAPKENYSMQNIVVTPVLQTNWTPIRSMGTVQNITTSDRSFRVIFNYELPVKPLWFVTVDEANLFLKITYTFTSAGNPVTKTDYVMFPLEDISPKPIV